MNTDYNFYKHDVHKIKTHLYNTQPKLCTKSCCKNSSNNTFINTYVCIYVISDSLRTKVFE